MTGIIHLTPDRRISRRGLIARAAATASVTLAAPRTISVAGQTPQASPMARGGTYMADARDRLRDLLSLVPSEAPQGPDPSGQLFDWVDYDAQLAAAGITDPYAPDADIVSASQPLVTSDPLIRHAMVADIPDLVGFRPLDVHQVLVTGFPPDQLLIYRGGIPVADLPALWEANGYERKTGDHGDYWTTGENAELDLQDPLQRIVFAAMNNAAVLDDTTVAFAATYARLEPMLALMAGEGDAATANAELDALIERMPAETVSAIALPGEAFLATNIVPENPGMEGFTTVEELLAESDDAVGPMPELLLSLSGVTAGASASSAEEVAATPVAGGAPDAQAFLMFLTASEEDAAAAAEVAYWRLENMTSFTTGQVYSEIFVPAAPVEEAVDGEVMIVRFSDPAAISGGWFRMLYARDTWPFVWLGDSQ